MQVKIQLILICKILVVVYIASYSLAVEFQVLLIELFFALFVGKLKTQMRFTHICSQDHIVGYVLCTRVWWVPGFKPEFKY